MATSTTREFWSNFHKYRAIVIAVFIFLICDAVVMITNIYSSFQISEAAISINLSGRQRMLSHRAVMFLALARGEQALEARGSARAAAQSFAGIAERFSGRAQAQDLPAEVQAWLQAKRAAEAAEANDEA